MLELGEVHRGGKNDEDFVGVVLVPTWNVLSIDVMHLKELTKNLLFHLSKPSNRYCMLNFRGKFAFTRSEC